ncbi:MAG: RtcB family protein, partial [Chlorobiaceae bacterium]|nr:RtcB family protein [Chlorobiaceae bacterium]
KNLANLPFLRNHVALMPDCHQGYGMPIGGVIATDNVIIPNAVGVDIGCGMIAIRTSITGIETGALKEIMGRVRQSVPVGFNHQNEAQEWTGFDQAPDIAIIQQELGSARKQLGTLGSGNHFIEFQEDEDRRLWVMIHSGSRNFGLKVASTYHEIAKQECGEDSELAHLSMDSRPGREYFAAMNYCLEFAKQNRKIMLDRVFDAIYGEDDIECILDVHHNYAAIEHIRDEEIAGDGDA